MPAIREEFVSATIEMARAATQANGCRTKHAALIVKGHRAISAGINFRRTHTGDGRRETYHAEFAALRKLKHDPSKPLEMPAKGAVLYSFRNNRERWSRPCAECTAFAQEKGVRLMVFTNALGQLSWEKL